MIKKEIPLLEYDENRKAVIEPSQVFQKENNSVVLPEYVVLCFFNDVIKRLSEAEELKEITYLLTEMGSHKVYEMDFNGRKLAVMQPGMGGPMAAYFMDELIARGGRKFIACGGAGVLDRNITLGQFIIPTAAVRDEGTSYHYLPPSREIKLDEQPIKKIEEVLQKHKYRYILAKTWTTDAIYRETADKVNLRREEGCLAVEMECSAFAAVARFRGVTFGQILYGGDDVSCEEYDTREWYEKSDTREELLRLAAEACLAL